MSIPFSINKNHITSALKSISIEKIPKIRKSTKYDLIFNGKKYPPKYVISIANKYVSGEEYPAKYFNGGDETNNFLIDKGFKVCDKKGKLLYIEPIEEDEERAFPEGKVSYKLHRRIERSAKVVKSLKRKRLRDTGDLICEICNFSFKKKYHERGVGYIEAHHIKPISSIKGIINIRISDLALVCSNCHRMLHRIRPWLYPYQLKNIISKEKKTI